MQRSLSICLAASLLFISGCSTADTIEVPASTPSASASVPAEETSSVTWKVKPSFQYQSVKEITGSFNEGYYGMKGYRKDIIAVSQDGTHYGIADYEGNLLTPLKYTTFDDLSYSLIGYGKDALLLGTEADEDYQNSPSTMDEINTDLQINTVEFFSQIGGAIGPVLYYSQNSNICYFDGQQADASFIDASVNGYMIFPSLENLSQTILIKDGTVISTIDHQLIYESPSYLRYPIVNGYIMYADKNCSRIPTAGVRSQFSYGSWIPGGCSYQDFDTMNTDTHFGYYNTEGQDITKAVYSDAYYFTDGYAAVSRNGKYGYIDETGKEAVPMIFDQAMPLYHGSAWVCLHGNWGVIDIINTLKSGITINEDTLA